MSKNKDKELQKVLDRIAKGINSSKINEDIQKAVNTINQTFINADKKSRKEKK